MGMLKNLFSRQNAEIQKHHYIFFDLLLFALDVSPSQKKIKKSMQATP